MEKVYSTHQTYINANNQPVPSATTVLKLLNKPALANWANSMGFRRKKIKDILDDSSLMGTNVHTMIEYELTGKEGEITLRDEGERIRFMSHMAQFREWRSKHELTPEFMERKCTSLGYGGTIDYYGLVDGKQTILDFKTSKRFYSSMFLQLGAYVQLVEEELNLPVEQVAIVRINDGKHEMKLMSRAQIEPYMTTFNHLVILYHAWFDLNLEDGWGNIHD